MRTAAQRFFSADYAAARLAFRNACDDARLDVTEHVHPLKGPENEVLATDVARYGPEDAEHLIVLVSGVHGVELLAGSACQTGWLRGGNYQQTSSRTAVLLIHGINCWGAAHLRRNTDGNVDLARNFRNFQEPASDSPRYRELHETLCVAERVGDNFQHAQATLRKYVEDHGMGAYIEALMGGQYAYPDGYSYGGTSETWANQTLMKIIEQHKGSARRATVIEYHTGLGPYGYGTAVTMHANAALAATRQTFGHWVMSPNQEPGGHKVVGHTTEGYRRAFQSTDLMAIVLEFGTYPPARSLPLLLDDHWLHLHGDPGSSQGRAIKSQLLEAHYPADAEWRQSVWERSQQVIRQAHGRPY